MLLCCEGNEFLCGIERRRHQREGLVLPVLSAAERRDRGFVVSAAGQMKAAEALDRDDRAVCECRGRGCDGVCVGREGQFNPLAIREPDPWPAFRACVGLGVKAPVVRVLVLGPAGGAHLERGHRRRGAVVGDARHDREARAAVGAVRERVAVTAVGGIEQLGQTVVAGRHVR